MKVYVVINDDIEYGKEIFHVASSRERADSWIRGFYEKHPASAYSIKVEEVEVDGDYLYSI